MSYGYVDTSRAAAHAPAELRAEFIRKTYMHLGGAILVFAALTAGLVNTPLGPMITSLAVTGYGWLVMLGLFMGVGWLAESWARSATSKPMQYLGLGLYVVAEAIIMTPLLYIAAAYSDPSVIPSAGIMTLTVFGGLTTVVFVTKKDFSWMGRFLTIAMFAALGFIIVSILFGITLGSIFSAFMVLLAAGYILYYTSQILHHYPVGSHVAAALNLFAAVALLFWYILQLFMGRE